jgi:hypothetical protein
MNYIRIFHAALLLALAASTTACQQRSNQAFAGAPPSSAAERKMEAGFTPATDKIKPGERLDAYIGDVFSTEQKALLIREPASEAPSF